eukprot:jgi/Orpsp1_1/1177798/evm.model.c7180000062897.1
MKTAIVFTALAALAAKASASCFSEKLGYPCCKGNDVVYTDEDGKWGVENNEWCGIADDSNCWATKFNYPCCENTREVVYTDEDGNWGVENGDWCGIKLNVEPQKTTTNTPQPSSEPEEPTYSFGYGLKNKAVPSKGCGKSHNYSGQFSFKWSQGNRKVLIDIPNNYDKNHPYRLVFGMMCMGGSSENVRNEGYYGLKPLDTEKTTIFVAPEGNGQQLPWGQADYQLFDELLDQLKNDLCIDESRVFSTGFSYGSMFSNGLSWNHQKVLRGVAVYETAERNIWLPQHTGEPIAWMGVLGFDDGLCTPEMGRHARDIILEHNSEGGKAVQEKAEEATPGGPHKCYDYKTVDERFPVRWCTQSGGHLWDHKDPGQWQSWVPQATWDFINKF